MKSNMYHYHNVLVRLQPVWVQKQIIHKQKSSSDISYKYYALSLSLFLSISPSNKTKTYIVNQNNYKQVDFYLQQQKECR